MVEHANASTSRELLIVARWRPGLYEYDLLEYLTRAYSRRENTHVMLDRRWEERRQQFQSVEADRRRGDRRRQPGRDDELRMHGSVLIRSLPSPPHDDIPRPSEARSEGS